MSTRKEYHSEYYRRNREKILEKTKQYNRDNKEQRTKHHKEWRNSKGWAWQMHRRARLRARDQGLEFNIEVEDIIVPDVCPILLIPIHKAEEKQSANSPSLDRVNSALGYIKGNIRVISSKANAAKSNLTEEEISRMLAYIRGEI